MKRLLLAVVTVAAASPTVALASGYAIPPLYKNCTALNAKYPHGIGRTAARDRTSGTPVTTFRRSTKLYDLAMKHNGRLDGDKNGVACESA